MSLLKKWAEVYSKVFQGDTPESYTKADAEATQDIYQRLSVGGALEEAYEYLRTEPCTGPSSTRLCEETELAPFLWCLPCRADAYMMARGKEPFKCSKD